MKRSQTVINLTKLVYGEQNTEEHQKLYRNYATVGRNKIWQFKELLHKLYELEASGYDCDKIPINEL